MAPILRAGCLQLLCRLLYRDFPLPCGPTCWYLRLASVLLVFCAERSSYPSRLKGVACVFFQTVVFPVLNYGLWSILYWLLYKVKGSFTLLQAQLQVGQHRLLGRLSFFQWMPLPPLSKIKWIHSFAILFLDLLFYWSSCLFLIPVLIPVKVIFMTIPL